jgi:RimJ/RimL family protein N-acetyltransferase
MKLLVVDQRERVCLWAAENMGYENVSFTNAYAIGLEDAGGELVAAAVFNQFHFPSISGHIVSDGSKKWMTKKFLYAMFDYPFRQLGCTRITAPIAERNEAAVQFVERLGFVLEGRLRRAMPDGSDRLIYGLLKEDCSYVA